MHTCFQDPSSMSSCADVLRPAGEIDAYAVGGCIEIRELGPKDPSPAGGGEHKARYPVGP